MAGAAISARGFGWRHASRKQPALQDLSFDIAPGETVLLLGESGAGKSTLLAAIAGVLGGDDEGDATGVITIDGSDARDLAHTRGTVGMLLQDPDSQVIASRVGDDVAFGCENVGLSMEETWRRVAAALDMVGLDLPLDHPTAKLSGGQKQRLALAGVIAMGARVIVLDEPTANLDPAGIAEVRRAIADVHERTGATLIVVEHRVETWSDICTRGLVLRADGTLLHDAPLSDIITRHGAQLATAGIWIPEQKLPPELRIPIPTLPAPSTKNSLVTDELIVGWDTPVGMPHNIALPSGRSTVIVGPNGAGKSTLALSLAGLLEPLSGTVHVAGYSEQPHLWRSLDLSQRIGFVFQDPEHQFLASTVLDELLLPARVHRAAGRKRFPWSALPEAPNNAKRRAAELLERLGLAHVAAANPFTLSGGQKRRLSVATALVAAPEIVILDEPTFGQDRRTFLDIVELLRELTTEGRAVASITHDALYQQLLGDHFIEVAR